VSTIALPRSLMPEIARHLDRFAEVGPDGPVFVGPYGVTPTRPSFGRIWVRAKKEVGDLVPAFISMICGTRGTISPRPRAQYSRADGSSRAREHAGRVDLSASHYDAGSGYRGGFLDALIEQAPS
jgi:hypothetical protein